MARKTSIDAFNENERDGVNLSLREHALRGVKLHVRISRPHR